MTSPDRIARFAALFCLVALAMSGGHAVGADGAPEGDMAATLRNACLALAAPRMSVGALRVDPAGTRDFAFALVTDARTGAEHVCAHEKASGRTALGGPLEAIVDPQKPFSPQDATQLSELRAQVAATLADLDARDLKSNGEASTVAALLSGRVKPDDLASFPPGPYRCTVYWYGFLEEGAHRVGAHRCTVSPAPDGGLIIDKATGDRFHGQTTEWENGLSAFYGRTWLEGQSERRYDPTRPDNADNDNFGNKVGLALRSGERLFLVSIDERGMTEPDPTFFEILELVPQL